MKFILRLPNIPDEDVPIGENESHNKEILKNLLQLILNLIQYLMIFLEKI